MRAVRISFITAVHNCLDLTEAMLASLEKHTHLSHCEVILVDDSSNEAANAFLSSYVKERSNHVLLVNQENRGFAVSNNRGANAASGEILVFLNNDLLLTPDWLPSMIHLLDTMPAAGVIGNVQRNAATRLVDHAGIFFDLQGMPTHAGKNRANPPAGAWIERNAVTAACMAVKRQTFLSIGGFDTSYRNGFEDVDLCLKLKKSGFRHYVSLQSTIYHHVSSSPGRSANNARNTETYRKSWSAFARTFGRDEWPREYFRRYARYWWRMNPKLAAKALFLLVAEPTKKKLPSKPIPSTSV